MIIGFQRQKRLRIMIGVKEVDRGPPIARYQVCDDPSNVFSATTATSPGTSPLISAELTEVPLGRIPSSPVDCPWLLKRIELRSPEAISSLVTAARFATRRMMRNGAITYSYHD